MDYSIHIPIREHSRYKGDFECTCKHCTDPKKYVKEWNGYSYIYSICALCDNRVWHYMHDCTLYGIERDFTICFYCRIPFYEKNMTNSKMNKEIKIKKNLLS